MRRTHTELYAHLVWSTWDRQPMIDADSQPRLYAAIEAKCREMGAEPLAIGGTDDHVHLLVQMPATLTVSTLVGEVKGSSSHLMTHEVCPAAGFKWQRSYAAFSRSKSGVPALVGYIARQAMHHERGIMTTEEPGADDVSD